MSVEEPLICKDEVVQYLSTFPALNLPNPPSNSEPGTRGSLKRFPATIFISS